MTDVIDSTAEDTTPGAQPTGYRRLIAGVIGGVVGGVLVLILGFLILPGYVQGRIDAATKALEPSPELEQRVAAVEKRADGLTDLPGNVSGLSGKVDDLQSGLTGLQDQVARSADQASTQTGGVAELKTAQDQLMQRVDQLAQRTDQVEQRPAPQQPDLAPLQTKIEALDKNVADLRSFGEQLTKRVDDVTSTDAATVERIDTLTSAQAEAEQRLNERAQQLADRVAATESTLNAKVADLAQAQTALGDLQSAVASQTSDLAATKQTLDQNEQQSSQAAAAVQDRVASVEKTVTDRMDQDRGGIATAVALTDLEQALSDGSAFPTAQAVLASAGKTDPTIAKAAALLQDSAADGVATTEALAEQLAALDQPAATGGSQDWVEQTRANILGLVTVKRADGTPVGGPTGAKSDESGQAQAKLAAGDLAGAIAAVQARPDADAEPVAAWLAKAKARADAQAATELLRQHLGELLVQPS